MTYSEKLKHPKWQKKRLEILQRDNFQCQVCGEIDEQLHVHHNYYILGNMPWEYNNNSLITLCDYCHKLTHEEKINEEIELLNSIYDCRYRIQDFSLIRNIFCYINESNKRISPTDLARFFFDNKNLELIEDYYSKSVQENG